MDGVVEKLEGLGAAADGGGGDVGAVGQEVVIELGKVLEVGVGLPIGVGLACLEGNGGVQAGLPYKDESRSNFRPFFYF